jgi:hypothetical protein
MRKVFLKSVEFDSMRAVNVTNTVSCTFRADPERARNVRGTRRNVVSDSKSRNYNYHSDYAVFD